MSRYLIIKNEIQTDPTIRGYADKDANEISALMNESLPQAGQFTGISISPQEIALVLIRIGKWEAVKNAVDDLIAAGHTEAFALWHLSNLGTITEDFTKAGLAAIISGLVSSGVLSTADRNAILAVARQQVMSSRGEIIGVGVVGQGDVEKALTL